MRLGRVTEIIEKYGSPFVQIDGDCLEFWFDTDIIETHDAIDLEGHGALIVSWMVSFKVGKNNR